MNKIVALSADERNDVFNEAGTELGLSPFYVEKDFWVCWTLGVLFEHETIGKHLTFRGGTSLSKGWGLIKRFSEDIDLAMARTWVDDTLPDPGEPGITSAQCERRLQLLRQACRRAIRGDLVPLLEAEVSRLSDEARIDVVDLDNARDPFVIELHYPTGGLAAPGGYHRAAVKIELGGRVDAWPQEMREIKPYVADALPALGSWTPVKVACVRPARTFWDKAALLHEQHTRPEDRPLATRQARHLYDLVKLWEHVSDEADMVDVFEAVMAHRRACFNYGWVDYERLRPGDLKLVPPEGHVAAWRADYHAMRPMFFEDPPAFDDLVAAIQAIETGLEALR